MTVSAVSDPDLNPVARRDRPTLPSDILGRVRGWARARLVTLTTVGLLVAVWLAERSLIGLHRGGRTIGYLAFGALPNASVVGRGSPGDWWRYVSDALVQDRGSLLHLGVNVAILLLVGPRVERLYGRRGCLATMALASAAGGLVWIGWSSLGLVALPDYTLGASAAACGLIGLLLAYAWFDRPGSDPAGRRALKSQAVLGIAVVLLLGLVVTGLNNAAHAGGVVAGVLVGLRLPPLPQAGGRPLRPAESGLLWGLVALTAVSVLLAMVNLGGRLLGH